MIGEMYVGLPGGSVEMKGCLNGLDLRGVMLVLGVGVRKNRLAVLRGFSIGVDVRVRTGEGENCVESVIELGGVPKGADIGDDDNDDGVG